MRHVWPDRRAAEIFVEAYEEIAEDLEEIAERVVDFMWERLEEDYPR